VATTESVIHQALFGYDDGHKLIASSLRLPTDVAVDLTVISDLAPGVRFEGSKGYWTGFPLPTLKRYALMRTWPAPEMPRPGCVWSHVVMLETEALAELSNLSRLAALFRRPSDGWNKTDYSQPISSFSSIDRESDHPHAWSPEIPGRLLTALYARVRPPVIQSAEPVDDALVFGVWSQQWPKLRRNFRFQTALLERPSERGVRFDLRFARRVSLDDESADEPPVGREFGWMDVAQSDLRQQGMTPLRTFLRTYGGDVSRPRASYIPLVSVFADAEAGRLRADGAQEVLALVAEAFPERSDAGALKQALISGSDRRLDPDPITLLGFLLTSPYERSFPDVPDEAVERLAAGWPSRREALLNLASDALVSPARIAQSVVEAVLAAIPDPEIWDATRDHPEFRELALVRRPHLIADPRVLDLDGETLVRCLTAIQQDAPFVDAVIANLMGRDHPGAVEWAFSRYPDRAVEVVVREMGRGRPFAPVWIRRLGDHPQHVLTPRILRLAANTFSLNQILRTFGPQSDAIAHAGAEPWVEALKAAEDNLERDDSLNFRAALLRLALGGGGAGREDLLQAVFDPLYDRAESSYLPHRVRETLDPVLPQLGYRNYDIALRLLAAVVSAFVFGGFKKKAFSEVSRRKKTQKALTDLASSIPDGRRFLKSL